MRSVLFLTKFNQEREFVYDWDEMPGFCACLIFHEFETMPYRGDWKKPQNNVPVRKEDIFRTICKYSETSMFFMGDKKDGLADKYIFDYVSNEPFNLRKYTGQWLKVTPNLSKYYRNKNSGNLVRHLTVTLEEIPTPPGEYGLLPEYAQDQEDLDFETIQ